MLFPLLTAVWALWLAAGCGDGAGDRAGDTTTIAVIPMGTTHEFWKSIHAGAVKAAGELGVDILWKGPLKEDDRDEQIQIVETMIASHVDAIVLSPMDDRSLVRPVMEALRQGIPTILVNSSMTGDHHVAYVATENYDGGVLAAKNIGRLLGGRGNLIVVRVNEGDFTCTQREAGFIDTINEQFPDIRILSDNQYAGVTTETAFRTCENLLNRFEGDVDAIFTPNESSTFGCLRALQDRGLAGSITFIGFDSTAKLIQAMESGELHGLIIQNPFRMGYEGLYAAVRHLRGEDIPSRIDTGVVFAHQGNMHDPEISELLTPDFARWLE
jgi:ribose transport system substrate-binding protein